MSREGTYQTQADALANPTTARQYWLDALEAAGDEEKDWRGKAERAYKIYNGETPVSFNILHSNVETQKPAIFNSMPVPDVRTRNLDKNPIAQKGAQTLERGVGYLLDEYDFESEMDQIIYDTLICGRGVSWINYKPTMGQMPDGMGGSYEGVIWQQAECERVPWDRFRRGPGASWQRVPWVARLKFYTFDDVVELAGEDVAQAIQYDATQNEALTDKTSRPKREKSVWEAATIWEIWDKDTRKVWYVSESYKEGPVAVIDDPLNLGDFFPCPRPLQVLSKRTCLTPIVPYSVYQDQADELAKISTRILKLVEMAKYRGVRASELSELDSLESLEDGQFIPSADAMALLNQGGSLDNAIWAMPLDMLIATIRELVLQREQIKQTIYEITGISDILRGATDPEETLGAQQIKAQWGSLKIQTLQKEVQRFVRDVIRIKAEIIAEKFTPDVLNMIAGEQLDPQVVQMLQSDVMRRFMIDIETDSTIRADIARNQQQMAQFLQATGQYLQVVAPAVQGGMLPPGPAVAIFSAFARTFKLGKQVEDELAKLSEQAEPFMQQQMQEKEQQKQVGQAAQQIGVQTQAVELEKKKGELVGQQIENRNAAMGIPSGPGIVN